MSDTPQTDINWFYPTTSDGITQVVNVDFARKLERRLTEVTQLMQKTIRRNAEVEAQLEMIKLELSAAIMNNLDYKADAARMDWLDKKIGSDVLQRLFGDDAKDGNLRWATDIARAKEFLK